MMLDNVPIIQKVAHSSIRAQAHSDYIVDEIRTYGLELDIVIEAKAKELALLEYRNIYAKEGVLL